MARMATPQEELAQALLPVPSPLPDKCGGSETARRRYRRICAGGAVIEHNVSAEGVGGPGAGPRLASAPLPRRRRKWCKPGGRSTHHPKRGPRAAGRAARANPWPSPRTSRSILPRLPDVLQNVFDDFVLVDAHHCGPAFRLDHFAREGGKEKGVKREGGKDPFLREGGHREGGHKKEKGVSKEEKGVRYPFQVARGS